MTSVIHFSHLDFLYFSKYSQEDFSFYPRRTPNDSKIDVDLSIREQFNKIKVSDPVRYPAFFELNGYKYELRINKIDEQVYKN